jgi:hypothetical protein
VDGLQIELVHRLQRGELHGRSLNGFGVQQIILVQFDERPDVLGWGSTARRVPACPGCAPGDGRHSMLWPASAPRAVAIRLIALSGTFDEFFQRPLIGVRERTNEAFERLEHDPPLRFGLQGAERAELQFHVWRNSNTELWIVPHPFTRTEAGRRSSAAGAPPPTARPA